MTSFTNPWNAQVGYTYDKAGRLTSVTGSGYAGVSSYASALTYRAFGGIKGMTYGNGRALIVTYDNRLRPTRWGFGTTQDYKYFYDYFNEHTGRVGYVQNMNDSRLDRSYEYDNFGRLAYAHTGAEARAATGQGQWGTMDGPYSLGFGYDVWGNGTHRFGWGGEVQGGSAGQTSDIYYTYNSSNRRTGFTYDAAGNLTNDLGQTFTYDATGQQISASYSGYSLQQSYDANGLRVKKVENGATTYYLRSSLFGGSVVAEIVWNGSSWVWNRGYVYSGSGLLAVQSGNAVSWVHEDPVTKSKRITNGSGTVVSSIELDPWGADAGAAWSSNSAFQPRKFTTYDRDANGTDEAMFRRYNRWHSRFDQPDPYDGSYDFTNPQSFNRYSYTQNDPVSFVDPSGLDGDLGGRSGITLNPPSGSVTITVSFDDFFRHGGSSGDGTEWRTLAVIDPGDLNHGMAGSIQLKPQNAAPGQRLSQADCDKKIAAIFGGPGAVAATVNEPSTLQHPSAGINRYNHLAGNGVFHLYTNAQGTEATVGLYTPADFIGKPATGTVYNGPNDPNPGQVNYNYERFNYPGGLSISFVHAGNPGLDRSDTNAAGSIRVGNIGGPGGAGDGYNHTHVNVYLNGKRVDPRSIFCK